MSSSANSERTNCFEVVEAQSVQAGRGESGNARWVLRGRAHVDLKIGDTLDFGQGQVKIESIRAYGKGADLLSAMMTGELTVGWVGGTTSLFLYQQHL
jgi:hypothetical protein